MKRFGVLAFVLALAGCGAAKDLKYEAGDKPPVAAYGATEPQTPEQMLTATTQERPQRSDEVLTSSEKRADDPFELPPS